jgi:ChrR-like protein with cupin domain
MAELKVKNGLELALHGQRGDWRDSRLEAEADSWSRLLAPLAMAIPGIAPPVTLWARIGRAVDQAEADLPQTVEERLEEGGWREIAPKIEVKQLWDDKTFLVRCGPGGVYPGTPHRLFEHCLIIQGDMLVGGQTYQVGDYHGVPAETAHGAFSSRTGLLMLVRYQ